MHVMEGRAADIFIILFISSPFHFLNTASLGFAKTAFSQPRLRLYGNVRPNACPLPRYFSSSSSSSPQPAHHHTPTHPPPIIEADSASRACTRHTRWLQHLERSLGHYSTPHYRKRRRGGDKEEEEEEQPR